MLYFTETNTILEGKENVVPGYPRCNYSRQQYQRGHPEFSQRAAAKNDRC
jgi:hypothetical protein